MQILVASQEKVRKLIETTILQTSCSSTILNKISALISSMESTKNTIELFKNKPMQKSLSDDAGVK